VNKYHHIIDLLCQDDNKQNINNACNFKDENNLISDNQHIVSDNSSLSNLNLVQVLKGDCAEGLAVNYSTEKTDALKGVITGVNYGGQAMCNDMVDNLNLNLEFLYSEINIHDYDDSICYDGDYFDNLKPSAFDCCHRSVLVYNSSFEGSRSSELGYVPHPAFLLGNVHNLDFNVRF
jgi:hypothetical protein